jgi:hypothetical protein
MEKIEEDVKKIEEDLEKIQCNPIIQLFKDFFKCIGDSLSYFLTKKT